MKPESADKQYMYGVISGGQALSLGPIGVGGRGDPIHTIPYEDLMALVSDCPSTDFAAMAKEDLVRELALHQQVVEQVMKHTSILPVKFGTLVRDEGRVKAILRIGYHDLKLAHVRMQNKVQVEVVATWDLDAVLKEVGHEEPIALLKAQTSEAASAATVTQRVRLGVMVKRSLDQRRDRYEREALDFLSDCCLDLQQTPLFDDTFVLNIAALIEKERQGEFEGKIEELDRRFQGRLNFRWVGPLPPYSFSTVEVTMMPYEEIVRAKELLELGEEASLAEIRKVYYREARKHHPDSTSSDDSTRQFVELEQAARLLTRYCLGQMAGLRRKAGSASESYRCSFSPAAVDRTILIAIKRSGGDTR